MKHSAPKTFALSALAILTFGVSLAACASANAETVIPNADLAKVQHICSAVMGLSPNEVHYDGCVDSLSHTVAGQIAARRTTAAREACSAKGLSAGSRDFAVCVVQGS